MTPNATTNENGVEPRHNGRSKSADRLDLAEIQAVLAAVKRGDPSARMPVDRVGLAGKTADALNEILEMNDRMRGDFAHINRTLLAVRNGDFSVRMTPDRWGSAR